MCHNQNMDFEDLIYERCAAAIEAIDITLASEIYALGLMYETFWNQDAQYIEVTYQSVIGFRYNTLSNWKRSINEASDEKEAKWNPSFWREETQEIAPRSVEYGEDPNDEEFMIRDKWCASLGIAPKGKDVGDRPVYDEAELNRATVAACQNVIQRLHQNGVTLTKFRASIPIVIYNIECGVAVQAMLAANPVSGDLQEVCECMTKWHGSSKS